jgi:mono/diheme cytochrome c family protein
MAFRSWSTGLVIIALAVGAMAQSTKSSGSAQIARGKYLVERTGMCADCHTPINEKGEPVRARHLGGGPLMFKSTVPVPGWVDVAPPIAGLPGFTDAQAIKFLTTGIGPNGKPAGPPMPAFRFNQADATAIVAYLRSLKTAEPGSAPAKSAKQGQ